ncbi:MAG TPA: AarF/UbiB family protein [Polyangiales bacterium]|nr:AarF/UbiB family protein [Polyangiales bacterium]
MALHDAAGPRSYRPRTSAGEFDARSAIKLWLQAVDAVLRAIETVAWEARDAAAEVQGVFSQLLQSSRVEARGFSAREPQNWASGWQTKLGRLTSAALTLGRVVASYRLHTTKAAFMSRASAARALEQLHDDSARRLYELCVRQGGALLKVGQILSSRPDLLPAAFVRELSRLQDAAPPVPVALIMRTIEEELGRPLEDLFPVFDGEPLAAASIGQVHRATLHDGREVAVKVQRPQISELVAIDLELLELFLKALGDSLPPIDLDTIVRETKAMIWAELDYAREAVLTQRMADFFAGDARIEVPSVVMERSSARVLTTTFMPGEKITTLLDRLHGHNDAASRSTISELLARVLEAYVRQTLDLGLFQADPHPGNLLAREDGTLVLLDFGCAKELAPEQLRILTDLAKAFVAKDAAGMALSLQQLGFATQSGTLAGIHTYAQTVLDEIGVVQARGGDWPTQVEVLSQLTVMTRTIENDPVVRLPEEFVMLGRVFGVLSGLFLHYRPDVAAAARILPIVLMALAKH